MNIARLLQSSSFSSRAHKSPNSLSLTLAHRWSDDTDEQRVRAPAQSERARGVLGPRDEVERDVLVAPEGGDVQRAPAVPVRETHVRAELDEQLDELEVPVDDGLVQRRLSLRSERVDVKLAAAHALQQRAQPLRVALPQRLLEDPLARVRLTHACSSGVAGRSSASASSSRPPSYALRRGAAFLTDAGKAGRDRKSTLGTLA